MKKNIVLLSLVWFLTLTGVQSDDVHKLIIIGGGVAGISAGIHAARINLQPLIIEGDEPGGLLANAGIVGNWPGKKTTTGPEIIAQIKQHAEHVGCTFINDTVVDLDFTQQPFTITVSDGTQFKARAIIIATGSQPKKLNCPGEEEYWGRGVATCVICDGPLFQDKPMVIVGGDERALGKALFLTRFSENITVICDDLTASTYLQQQVLGDPAITVLRNKALIEIVGNGTIVTSVIIKDLTTKEEQHIITEGVFYAVGAQPQTAVFKGHLALDAQGYICLSDYTKTSVEGVFAAGTATDIPHSSANVASGMGSMVAMAVEEYFNTHFAEQGIQKHTHCTKQNAF